MYLEWRESFELKIRKVKIYFNVINTSDLGFPQMSFFHDSDENNFWWLYCYLWETGHIRLDSRCCG